MRSALRNIAITAVALAAPTLAFGQFWPQWMVNPQHTGTPNANGQHLNHILASVVYDHAINDEINFAGGDVLVHYQVPLVDGNKVYMEFKTGTLDPNTGDFITLNWGETGFKWQGGSLVQVWAYQSDWKAPGNENDTWEPVFHAVLANDAIYLPGASGSIIKLNKTTGAFIQQITPTDFDAETYETGPITVDGSGNLFYNAIKWAGISGSHSIYAQDATDSWLVKVTPSGSVSKVSYSSLTSPDAPSATDQCYRSFRPGVDLTPWPPTLNAAPPTITCGLQRVGLNISPAIAPDGTIYSVTRPNFADRQNFLVAIKPNLTRKWVASLKERFHDGCNVPVSAGGTLPPNDAPNGCRHGATTGVDPGINLPGGGRVLDDSSSTPAVGPDGSVFYGAYTRYNWAQGHMMKFDKNGHYKGAYLFGWDETPSIVVGQDTHCGGDNSNCYALVIKDNHYGGLGAYCNNPSGDPNNPDCSPDRNGTQPQLPTELFITQLDQDLHVQWKFKSTQHDSCTRQPDGSITCVADTHPDGFEWCVNGHSVDVNGVVYANSEDGFLYAINQGGTLKQRIFQQLALGAAYTPTSMGSDGKIYSQNKGILFVVGN